MTRRHEHTVYRWWWGLATVSAWAAVAFEMTREAVALARGAGPGGAASSLIGMAMVAGTLAESAALLYIIHVVFHIARLGRSQQRPSGRWPTGGTSGGRSARSWSAARARRRRADTTPAAGRARRR